MKQIQRGNILFLILLAVVLFAALSYAVTSSLRGGGKNASNENYRLQAANIIQSFTLMDNTINRWMLSGGYNNINKIDFRSSGMSGTIGHVTGCTTTGCNMFNPAGGNIDPELSENLIEPTSSCAGADKIVPTPIAISVAGIGTDQSELVLQYACIRKEICDEINVQLGIWRIGDAYINTSSGAFGTDHTYYQGSAMMTDFTPNRLGSADSRVNSQYTFCARLPASGYMTQLFHVLYAR